MSAAEAMETVDVLIVGSGPAGSTYARTIGDALPDARILMVEVGPAVPGTRGDHTQNMTEEDRLAVQLLTQGPDAGVERAAALSDIAPGIDPSLEFRQTILPGLFFVDPRPPLADGDVGLPAASMSSGVGGMGIHWGTSCPRPHQSERIPFLPAEELDAALSHAEGLLGVHTPPNGGSGLLRALRDAIAGEFDGPGLTPTSYMPTATHWDGTGLRFSGTGVILGDLEATVPGFELRSETLVRRVLLEDGVAVGAELEDRRTGERSRVSARFVVVCADGLRTPQVLFASGVRPRALGHHLNEHYQMATMLTLGDEFDPAAYTVDAGSIGSVIVPFSDARPMQGGVISLAGSAYKLRRRGGVQRDGDGLLRHAEDDHPLLAHREGPGDDRADAPELVAERRPDRHAAGAAGARCRGFVAALPGDGAHGRRRRRRLGVRSAAAGVGCRQSLRRGQRGHPDRDGGEPDAHHGGARLARGIAAGERAGGAAGAGGAARGGSGRGLTDRLDGGRGSRRGFPALRVANGRPAIARRGRRDGRVQSDDACTIESWPTRAETMHLAR